LLYAGNTSFNCFEYYITPCASRASIFDKVKISKQRSQSAGNISNETSETLRNGIVVNSEYIKRVFDHVPKHSKPINDEEFGHYLAGLIDGDGHFNNIPHLVIVFSVSDAFLVYFIKEKIGYGNVRKVKNKNAYVLVISNKEGILRVVNLINGKIRITNKFNQVINNILSNNKYTDFNIHFTLNTSNDFNNH
jgi:hypothetical protein